MNVVGVEDKVSRFLEGVFRISDSKCYFGFHLVPVLSAMEFVFFLKSVSFIWISPSLFTLVISEARGDKTEITSYKLNQTKQNQTSTSLKNCQMFYDGKRVAEIRSNIDIVIK